MKSVEVRSLEPSEPGFRNIDVPVARQQRMLRFAQTHNAQGAQGSISYSPSSSSNSPSSSAVASWYCWYSLTRSFMFDSASVNSISSMPSPVYQWRKALRLNMAVKYSATRLNISWIAVELPRNATAILRPFGGMSHTELLMLFGIHSTK